MTFRILAPSPAGFRAGVSFPRGGDRPRSLAPCDAYLSRAPTGRKSSHGCSPGHPAPMAAWCGRRRPPSQMLVEVATTAVLHDARLLPPMAGCPKRLHREDLLENLPRRQDIFYRVRFRDLSHTDVSSEPAVGRFRTRRPTGAMSASSGAMSRPGRGIIPTMRHVTFATMASTGRTSCCISGDTIYADGVIPSEVKLPTADLEDLPSREGKSRRDARRIPARAQVTISSTRIARLQRRGADLRAVGRSRGHEQLVGVEGIPAAYKVPISPCSPRAARAFHEMYPMRESIVESGRVYRTLGYGPHLDVFMLDERSYRGPNGPNCRHLRSGHYFIGPDQLAWLKRGLLNSRATLEGDRLRHAAQPHRL